MHRTIKVLIAVVAATATVAGVALAATTPSVSTGKATSVQETSAVLNGTINPNGTTSYYHFEWGLTTAYGVTSSAHSAGFGTKAVAVKATATGLIPGTVYHYRVGALSKAGGSLGTDRTFKTAGNPPPGAVTGPVSGLSSSGATVTGVINANNQATTYYVQFGPTIAYDKQTLPQVIGANKLALPVSAVLTQISAGQTVHYRLVAQHSNTPPQYGADATFVTYPSPRPVPRVIANSSPRRAKSRPYVFTTSGRVTTSPSLPQALQCTGNVTARFSAGTRRVTSSLFALGPDCRFSGSTTFHRLPGRGKKKRQVHLTVLISFGGNPYSAPATARTETVTLG